MSEAFIGGWLLWYSLWLGIILGVVYDILRIRRIATARSGSFGARRAPISLAMWNGKGPRRSKVGAGLLFVEDLLFALFAAVSFLLLFYSVNGGIVRWYAFVGAGMSFVVYRLTIGRLLMCLSDRITRGIRCVIGWLWKRMVSPLARFLFSPVRLCVVRIHLAVTRACGWHRERRLLALAARGILPQERQKRKKKKKEA